jgi:N-acetylglucosaminyldiphosphoundecaprenol N-acetyl-beta-D-mannosaminyltransferase
MNYPSVPVMGYQVFSGKLNDIEFDNGLTVINTINAYSYVVAEKDSLFKDSLLSSQILVADGFPIVMAARILGGYKIRKIAGADIFAYILKYANKRAETCFFLGSNAKTLEMIKARINKEYPKISVSCFSPPYKANYTYQENAEMINAISQARPFALFVGMTAPKQEKWVDEHKNKLPANVICSIGAVFDFYAETIKRPSETWVNLKLEWFVRFLKEPKRLARRYFIYSPKFFGYLLKYKIKG